MAPHPPYRRQIPHKGVVHFFMHFADRQHSSMAQFGAKHNRSFKSSRGESVGVGRRSTGRGRPGASAGNPGVTANDALYYLMKVKDLFQSRRDKYDMFLNVMRDFNAQRIDTAGVIARVKDLFKGHPWLILGFNIFLPEGFVITLNDEDETPPKKIYQLEEAISFVMKIKRRFQNDVHVYVSFLDALNMYKKGQMGINEVYDKVVILFNGHQDLLDEFTAISQNTSGTANPLSLKRFPMERSNLDEDKTFMELHKKQKTRRTHDEDYKEPVNENEGDLSKQHDTDKLKYVGEVEDGLKYSCSKGFTFCEKVKERVPADYQAFLKCLDIYSTEKITRDELQSSVADIIEKYPDLMEGFNEFIEHYEHDVGFLAGVTTKLNDGFTNSKLVQKEEQDEIKEENEYPLIEFEEAISFAEKIKERFQNNDHVYKSLLEILSMYKKEHKNSHEVHHEVVILLNGHLDLLDAFIKFLPNSSAN